MIWTEQPDQFYVFFDQDHQFARFEAEGVKGPNFLSPPEPLPTPTGATPASTPVLWPTAPPPGAFEPVSGFGRVWQHYWRNEHNLPVTVRQDIGWAAGPEFEFETVYQCAMGSGVVLCAALPVGMALSFALQSTVQDRWVWKEVTAP